MSSKSTVKITKTKKYFVFIGLFNLKDVMSVIGTPSSVYYKSEELSKLNASENSLSLSNLSQQNDYFYNYITLGLVCTDFYSYLRRITYRVFNCKLQ